MTSAATASPPNRRAVMQQGWLPRIRWWVGTAIAVVVVGFMDLSFAVLPMSNSANSDLELWYLIGWVAAVGSGVAMIWRRSHSLVVLVYCAIATLLTPMGPFGVLGALTWVFARASLRTLAWVTPLTASATAIAMWRDWSAGSYGIMTTSRNSTDPIQLSGWGYVAVTICLVVITVGVGLLRRYRTAQQEAMAQVEQRDRKVAQLRGELDRQEERELIAREMHDTVAHNLSLVALSAGALEVTSADPAAGESAREMRKSAHRALEEMRTLISSLRDSGRDGYTGSAPRMEDLSRLVADAQRAGANISASLEVDDDAEPAPALTRAVYRITQEALTNAIKHAPGSGVALSVKASPEIGVLLDVASWLPPGGSASTTGSGAGLVGMTERATALGGTLTAAPVGEVWRVHAALPWHTQAREE